jgi:hypothetical protein
MEQLFGVRTVVLVTAFFAFLVFMSFLNYKRNLAEFKRVALGLFGCWCFFLFILTMHSSLVEELKSAQHTRYVQADSAASTAFVVLCSAIFLALLCAGFWRYIKQGLKELNQQLNQEGENR